MTTLSQYTLHKDIPYSTILNDVKVSYDLYLPNDANKESTPLLFYVHGGAWRTGDKNEYTQVGENLASNYNIAVMMVNYHLSTGTEYHHPSHSEEVSQALIHAVENPNQFPYSNRQIYVTGHSCGAQIISLIAFNPATIQPFKNMDQSLVKDIFNSVKALITIQGIYCIPSLNQQYPQFDFIAQAFGTDEKVYQQASPTFQSIPTFLSPKFLIVQGPNDEELDFQQTQLFINYLNKTGIQYELDQSILVGHYDIPRSIEFAHLAAKFIKSFQ